MEPPSRCAEEPPEAEEARDPRTPAVRLAALARHENAAVRTLVARNPATPPGTLAALAAEHWEDLLENPAIPLLLLDQPTWLTDLPIQVLRAAMASAQTPLGWLDGARTRYGAMEEAIHARRHDLVARWCREETVLQRLDRSPLFFAVEHDQDDTLRVLLDLGLSPLVDRYIYADGNNHQIELLEETLLFQKPRCARVLLATGAYRPAHLTALLTHAVSVASVENTRLLHDHGARFGQPLLDAVYQQDEDQVRALLDASPKDLRDALALASFVGNLALVQTLLAAGANLHERSTWHRTPLWMATHQHHTAIVLVLLQSGANPDDNSWINSPRKEAAEQGFHDLLALFQQPRDAR